MTSHLDEGTLHELLDGEIPSSDLPPIQAHLAACSECRARLDGARGFEAASEDLLTMLDTPADTPREKPAPVVPLHRAPWARNLAWAATVVLAVGAGYFGGRGAGADPAPHLEPAMPLADAPQETVAPVDRQIPSEPSVGASANPAPPPASLADQPASRDEAGARKSAAESNLELNAKLEKRADESAPAAPPAAAAPPPAPVEPERRPPAPPPALLGRAANDSGRQRSRLDQVVVTGMTRLRAEAAQAREGTPPVPVVIESLEAIRRLNGSLRLIEGMIPDRFEAVGTEVRVVYPLAAGELYLTQQLVNGRVVHRLVAPAGFSPDSLQRLQARIREE